MGNDAPFDDDDPTESGEAVALPIDGVLDLHTFHPREVRDLVHEYIEAALERDLGEIRIIHGKGTGVLRRTVQAVLERHPRVAAFQTADGVRGGWGATIVTLRRGLPK